MEFTSNQEGAESVDIQGHFRPKQIFAKNTFCLMQDVSDYVGKALRQFQVYLVEVRLSCQAAFVIHVWRHALGAHLVFVY